MSFADEVIERGIWKLRILQVWAAAEVTERVLFADEVTERGIWRLRILRGMSCC